MNYLRRPLRDGEVVPISRSASYWSGRADQHRQRGNRRKAAALLRHAVSLAPADSELKLEYALLLQDMSCYEASTRAAFAGLTADPARYDFYGVIGRNMMSLGREQEAIDAFSHYLSEARRADESVDVDEWAEDLDEVEALYLEQQEARCERRYQTLLRIAGLRIGRGDIEAARWAIRLAARSRFRDERVHTLRALVLQAEDRPNAALRCAKEAARVNACSVQTLCTLASLYFQLGRRGATGGALLRALAYCRYPQEKQFFAGAATSLGFSGLALRAMRAEVRESPDRLPALYDLAVTLLHAGRTEEAAGYLSRCRALDSTDLPSQYLSQSVEYWGEAGFSKAQVRLLASATPYYPALSAMDRRACVSALADAVKEGLASFCDRLTNDPQLRETLLYTLSIPGCNTGRLFAPLAQMMPREAAETLLREALVRPSATDEAKQYAAAALVAIGAKPPYLMWHAGRIAEIDPAVTATGASVLESRRLALRLLRLQRGTRDPRLMTHALHLLALMTPRELHEMAVDYTDVYRLALERHYRLSRGLAVAESATIARSQRRRTDYVLARLKRLLPISGKEDCNHANH